MNLDIIDEIIKVSNEDAFQASRSVAKLDGVLVGISSGAAIHAATVLAKREENKDKYSCNITRYRRKIFIN